MRIRSLKPEFWVHPVMARLPAETQLMAIAIICWSDDHGYFEADPRAIRGAVMPYRDSLKTIERDLKRLAEVGFIEVRETPKHGRVGRLPKWRSHQKVSHPSDSNLLPHFTDPASREAFRNDSGAAPEPFHDDRKGEEGKGSGEEGKGGEGKAPAGKRSGKSTTRKPTTQAVLEVVPPPPTPEPKTPTLVQRVHAHFAEGRDIRCRRELSLPEVPPDDAPNWARSAAVVGAWASFNPLDDAEAGEAFALVLVDAYLKDPYWAGATHRDTGAPQPYPWNALLSEKVWRPLAERLDRELTQPAAGGVH